MEIPLYNIGLEQAEKIAINFLEQYHSIIKVEKITLEDRIWLVGILVSSPDSRKITVKVNARTGYILGWK